MINLALHILKYKFLSFLKVKISLRLDNFLKSFGSLIVYSSFAIGAFYFSHEVVKYLLEEMKIGLFLLHEFFSITLFIFFIAVNVGNIIVSYSTLYKSQEVNYLYHKPVPPGVIFAIKFLDNFFYSSSTLILILLSVLGGYAYYLEFHWVDVLILFLFNFVPFMLSAASLGIIILLILVKLATVIGIRTVIISLAAIYLTLLYTFFDIISPVELVNRVMEYYPNIDLYFGKYLPAALHYFPNHWLSTSLYWIARDNYTAAYSSFYLQIVLSLVLFFSALSLGIKWYHKTWFYEFKLRREKKVAEKDQIFPFSRKSKLGVLKEALFKREFHNFFREPTQIFHAIVLFLLILIFLSSVSSIIRLKEMNIFLQTVVYLAVFVFNVFLVSTLSLRFVFPLVSLEGKTFWKIKSAPISTISIFRLKLLPYFIIILFFGLLLNIVVNFHFGFQLLVFTSLIMIFITSSIVLLNFSIGGLFANYNEKNPIRIASSQGASLSFLINLVLMVLLVIFLYTPLSIYFTNLYKYGILSINYFYYTGIGIIFFSGIIFLISHKLILVTIKRDF